MPKDANDLLIEWTKEKVKPAEQARRAKEMLKAAKPFILYWADEISEIENEGEKQAALKEFFADGVARLSEQDQAGYKDLVCRVLDISKFQWNDRLKALNGSAKKKGEIDEGEPDPYPGGWLEEHFIGLEYDPELGKTFFAVRFPDGHLEDRLESLTIQRKKYVPIYPNSTIRKRVILLPSEMTELKSEEELLFAIKAHNHKYFDFGNDETFEQLCMIYPFFTYMASSFRTVPYLRALGDYGTGKSRLLKTIGPLCHQPIMTNAGSSAAALMRILDLYRNSTLVLDEADFKDSTEATLIAKILNGGNEKGQAILRAEKESNAAKFDVEAYEVFGPKVLGSRKKFGDDATESRCLTKEMMPIQPHPRIPLDLPPIDVYEAECRRLRNALFTYMMHHIEKDRQVDLGAVDRSIDPRTAQVAVSLMTVMKSERGRELVMDYLRAVTEERKGDRYETFTARVLEGLVLAWAWGPVSERLEDAMRVYLKDIALATNQVVDQQNRQMGDLDDEADEEGKPKMKSRKITPVFKKYLNIKSIRATDGIPEYKGTRYVDMTVEIERVKGLCERWGVEWLERGSVSKGTTGKEEPPHVDPFEEERRKWKQAGMQVDGEQDE